MVRPFFLILSVSFCTIISQLILKKGLMKITANNQDKIEFSLKLLIQAIQSPYVWSSLVLQTLSFCIWIIVISKYKLGFAFGISGAFFYILLPFFSWITFGERLSFFQWVGLVLITTGIVFMTIEK
jgi:multidrug transporter EmrE-like cation transporter